MTLEVTDQRVLCDNNHGDFERRLNEMIEQGWQVDSESIQIVGGRSEHFKVDWFAVAVMYKVEEKPDTSSGVFESADGKLKRVE